MYKTKKKRIKNQQNLSSLLKGVTFYSGLLYT